MSSISNPEIDASTFDFDALATVLEHYGVAKRSTIFEVVGDTQKANRDALKRLIAAKHLTAYQAKIVEEKGSDALVFGEYLLVDTLGAGGMGEVFKAKNLTLGRMEAIKTIRADEGIGELLAKRFKQEARLLALLEHGNFVPIYRYGRVGDVDFIAMRFVEGETLKSQIDRARKENKYPPFRQVCQWFAEAAKALEYAHKAGVIHRDLKPSNLMIGPRGNIVVLDMGIARLVDDGSSAPGEGLTASSRALGTPEYMPPEQWADARAVNYASDVYSLGVSMFHVLTGQVPFKATTLTELMLAHTTETPLKASSLRKDIPRSLDAVMDRCLAKKPADRFSSMAEFAEALEKIAGQTVAEPTGSSKATWAAGVVVLIAAVAGLSLWKREPKASPAINPSQGAAPASTGSADIASNKPPAADPDKSTAQKPASSGATKPEAATPTQPIRPSPVDWLADYASAHPGEWPHPADLKAFAMKAAGNDAGVLAQKGRELVELLDSETRRRRLEKLAPFDFLTAEATRDNWSTNALAGVKAILALQAQPEDKDLRIDATFVDPKGNVLDKIEVDQRFNVAVKTSKDAYVTILQLEKDFLFILPFPKVISADQTLTVLNGLVFGSPGRKSLVVYASDRRIVDQLVPPDPDDMPRLPRLFATRDAYERVAACLREGKPVAGVAADRPVRHWSRTTVHLDVKAK